MYGGSSISISWDTVDSAREPSTQRVDMVFILSVCLGYHKLTLTVDPYLQLAGPGGVFHLMALGSNT